MKLNNPCDVAYTMGYSDWHTKEGRKAESGKRQMEILSQCNDDLLRSINKNLYVENYTQDPIYQYMEKLKNKEIDPVNGKINYFHFTHGYQTKIKNRNLLEADYVSIFDPKTETITTKLFEEYYTIQQKYKSLGCDVMITSGSDKSSSYREISGHFSDPANNKSRAYSILSTGEFTFKESISFLEEKLDEINSLLNDDINIVDIGHYLGDENYIKIIDLKKDLGEVGNVSYEYNHFNKEHSLGGLGKGPSIDELVEKVESKKFLLEQFNTTEIDNKKVTEAVKNRNSYSYLYDFWLGENNAQAGFIGPSSGRGLALMNCFDYSEYETSARILMKLMSEYGNNREIDQELCNEITINNLSDVRSIKAIEIKDGIVRFTEQSIKRIKGSYESVKTGKIERIKKLSSYFKGIGITLPEEYQINKNI